MSRLLCWSLTFLAIAAVGCTKPVADAPPAAPAPAPQTAAAVPYPPPPPAKPDGKKPEQIVDQFLQAVKGGKKDEVASLLTHVARTETDRQGLAINSESVPDANYQVVQAVYPPEDPGIAHVSSLWSEGKEQYEIIWVLRQEQTNWRIMGMALTLVENQDPVLMNFENPQEMLQMREEAAQAAEATVNNAAAGDASAPPMLTPDGAQPLNPGTGRVASPAEVPNAIRTQQAQQRDVTNPIRRQ